MADILDLIRRRRSVRRMKDTPLPPATVERLFEAARLAPSWDNRQCWDFVAITDPQVRAALALAGGPKAAMAVAPLIVVACARPQASGQREGLDYFMLDMGIAVEHLILEAASLGLGTCWVGWFDEERVRQILAIPPEVRVVAMVPVGLPDEEPSGRPRRSMEEILSWNRWGERTAP
jgi:nitroreductase